MPLPRYETPTYETVRDFVERCRDAGLIDEGEVYVILHTLHNEQPPIFETWYSTNIRQQAVLKAIDSFLGCSSGYAEATMVAADKRKAYLPPTISEPSISDSQYPARGPAPCGCRQLTSFTPAPLENKIQTEKADI